MKRPLQKGHRGEMTMPDNLQSGATTATATPHMVASRSNHCGSTAVSETWPPVDYPSPCPLCPPTRTPGVPVSQLSGPLSQPNILWPLWGSARLIFAPIIAPPAGLAQEVGVNRAVFWSACPICPLSRRSRMEKLIFLAADFGQGSVQRWSHLGVGCASVSPLSTCLALRQAHCTCGAPKRESRGYRGRLPGFKGVRDTWCRNSSTLR